MGPADSLPTVPVVVHTVEADAGSDDSPVASPLMSPASTASEAMLGAKIAAFGVAAEEESRFAAAVAAAAGDEAALQAMLAELDSREAAALEKASVEARDAALEWLSMKKGKSTLKKRAKKLVQDALELRGEDMSGKLAKQLARTQFLDNAVRESAEEVSEVFKRRRDRLRAAMAARE
jgi:NADPH-dependent ferric siderophore reductase